MLMGRRNKKKTFDLFLEKLLRTMKKNLKKIAYSMFLSPEIKWVFFGNRHVFFGHWQASNARAGPKTAHAFLYCAGLIQCACASKIK